MATSIITQDRLRELLSYDPLTGLFIWRIRRSTARFGTVAGSVHKRGYINIQIDKRVYRAHRLAWLHIHGQMPANQIDHIDGNRANNRLDNLRTVTNSENQQNLKTARRDNLSTGFLGVRKLGNRFLPQIKVNGKFIYLGYFDTPEAAHDAYLVAKRIHHPFGTI